MEIVGISLYPYHDGKIVGSNRGANGQFQAVLGLVHIFWLGLPALPGGKLLLLLHPQPH